jgi:hypothetical protein
MKKIFSLLILLPLLSSACNEQVTAQIQGNTNNQSTLTVKTKENQPRIQLAENNSRFRSLYCHPISKLLIDGLTNETTALAPDVDLIIDFDNKTYTRLDTKGSDTYDAQFNTAGVYTNIQTTTPKGVLVKVQTEEVLNNDPFYLTYMEIVTLGLDSYISHGTCSTK